MRSLALLPLAFAAVAAAASHPRPTDAARFAQNCASNAQRWQRFEARIGPVGGRREVGRIDRARWDSLSADDRNYLLWGLAYRASCPTRRPGTFTVRVVDRQSRPIRHQSISTELECHGDRFPSRPDITWYGC